MMTKKTSQLRPFSIKGRALKQSCNNSILRPRRFHPIQRLKPKKKVVNVQIFLRGSQWTAATDLSRKAKYARAQNQTIPKLYRHSTVENANKNVLIQSLCKSFRRVLISGKPGASPQGSELPKHAPFAGMSHLLVMNGRNLLIFIWQFFSHKMQPFPSMHAVYKNRESRSMCIRIEGLLQHF